MANLPDGKIGCKYGLQRSLRTAQSSKTLPSRGKDAAEERKFLSGIVGVSIGRFVRYRGRPNTYQLEVSGKIIDIPNIRILDSQTLFRRWLLNYTGQYFAPMKPAVWHEFLSRLFATIEDHAEAANVRQPEY